MLTVIALISREFLKIVRKFRKEPRGPKNFFLIKYITISSGDFPERDKHDKLLLSDRLELDLSARSYAECTQKAHYF